MNIITYYVNLDEGRIIICVECGETIPIEGESHPDEDGVIYCAYCCPLCEGP